MANWIRKTWTKTYQKWPHIVKDMTKTFWCVFRFTVLTAVHLQNANARCDKVGDRHYSDEGKTYTFLYDKFTQDNMYRILSQSVRFYYYSMHYSSQYTNTPSLVVVQARCRVGCWTQNDATHCCLPAQSSSRDLVDMTRAQTPMHKYAYVTELCNN